jgi:hypothetical protein
VGSSSSTVPTGVSLGSATGGVLIRGSDITARTTSGAPTRVGVHVTTTGAVSVQIDHSRVLGATNTVDNDSSSSILIGNTLLSGGAVVGLATCAGVYSETYVFSASTCP